MACAPIVVIDDRLLAEAQQLTGLPTAKAVIEEALRTLVRLKAQAQVRAYMASCSGRATWTPCAATGWLTSQPRSRVRQSRPRGGMWIARA